ncbi:SERTA domain-containing protein, partial [Trichonephila clavata]
FQHSCRSHVSYLSHPRGLKRKHPEDSEDEDPPQPVRHSPIRSIRKDMERDGIQVNGLTRESNFPIWSIVNNPNNQVSNLDPPPNTNLDILSGYPNVSGVDRPPTACCDTL